MVTANDDGPQSQLRLASQVQHLSCYLGAAEPISGDPDLVHPADMAAYGFKSARDVMDMCSAVGIPMSISDTSSWSTLSH